MQLLSWAFEMLHLFMFSSKGIYSAQLFGFQMQCFVAKYFLALIVLAG